MADVWIARKRWTCKYCNLTINDDVPSRRQHENGLRHKNNVERALKGFYRKGEQEKKDAEYAKREMEKIEKQAMASYALDQAAASASTSVAAQPAHEQQAATDAAGASVATGVGKNAGERAEWKPDDKLSAYSTAQSLGYDEDPEFLRRQREEEQRRDEGLAGQWEAVAPPPPPAPSRTTLASTSSASSAHHESLSERQEARSFRLRERRAPGLGSHSDDDGLADIKVKKRIKVESSRDAAAREDEARSRMLPTWTPVRLEAKKEKSAEPSTKTEASIEPTIKAEGTTEEVDVAATSSAPAVKPDPDADSTAPAVEQGAASASLPATAVKREEGAEATPASSIEPKAESTPPPPESSGGGMFKKRRAGAGAGAKRVRALV